MPAPRRVSFQQLEVLLSFLEEHREMAKGQAVDTSQAKAAVRGLWEELAARLNAQGTGVHKNPKEWRDYWRDMKYRVKKKAGELEVDRRRTGGGPPAQPALSEIEQRVFAIIGTRAVLGDEDVRIPFDPEFVPQWSPPPSPANEIAIYADAGPSPPPAERPVSPRPSTSSAPLPPCSPAAEAATPAATRRRKGAPGPGTSSSPSAEAASPAAKRKKGAPGPGTPSTVEIPQPRWAWEAEQNRLALDERRLRVEESVASSIARQAAAMESIKTSQELAANSMARQAAALERIGESVELSMEILREFVSRPQFISRPSDARRIEDD